VHDPLRPDVHPAAGGHLTVVRHAELGGLVEVGRIVEFAYHESVGVDHAGRIAVGGKQAYGVTGRDHQRLGLAHLLQILLDQPVLHPVLEHLAGLAVGDQLVGVQGDREIKIVVDV